MYQKDTELPVQTKETRPRMKLSHNVLPKSRRKGPLVINITSQMQSTQEQPTKAISRPSSLLFLSSLFTTRYVFDLVSLYETLWQKLSFFDEKSRLVYFLLFMDSPALFVELNREECAASSYDVDVHNKTHRSCMMIDVTTSNTDILDCNRCENVYSRVLPAG